MQNSANIAQDQEILERINRIVLLRLKTLIVGGLKKNDVAQFEKIVKSGNSNLLLNFAGNRIPNFSKLFYQELEDIKKEMDYISSLLKELKLKPFTEEEHIEQCNKLNSLKDMHFDFLKQSPEDIKMKFKGYF